MKKLSLILAAAAMLLMTACTTAEKIDLNGTSWGTKDINGDRQITYRLSLSKNTGELYIYDYVSSNYNWTIRYRITSYTFDGESKGTMTFEKEGYDPNWHGPETHDFDLRVNGTKMGFGNPYRSTVLDRTR